MTPEKSPQPFDSRHPEEEAVLSAVLNTVIDAIVTIDGRGTILQVNNATCRMFQYTRQELLGQNISSLMPSPDRERHDGYLRRYLETGQKSIIGVGREVEAVRKDGSRFMADLAVSETSIGSRKLFTGVLRDMTQRLETQAALERERSFAKNLVETSNAVIVLLDAQGKIVHVNPFLEQLTGYSLDDIRGQDWFDLVLPADFRERSRQRFYRVLSGTPHESYTSPFVTRSGVVKYITWSARRLFQADGLVEEGVLKVGADVTELKAAEQKLIQSERLAAIGQMVTGLAHESRNALQRSRACLDMLELDIGDAPDQLELVKRIQQALTELQRLYEEVRDYAAPVKLELEQCHLLEIARDTWDLLREHPQRKFLELNCDSTDPEPLCRCDWLRIQQVFRNIFENTLNFAPRGTSVMVRCQATTLHGQPAFELQVRDQGPGLNSEQARRIFEPFFTTSTKGTGLGMAISQRIIDAHGGLIQAFQSNPGKGAEIIIVLPQAGPTP